MPEKQQTLYRWLGSDARNTARGGQFVTDDLPDWVEQKFNSHYRGLRVTDYGGALVAEIVQHPDTHKRTWWAEGAERELSTLTFGVSPTSKPAGLGLTL